MIVPGQVVCMGGAGHSQFFSSGMLFIICSANFCKNSEYLMLKQNIILLVITPQEGHSLVEI
jgi:hypothetical protein